MLSSIGKIRGMRVAVVLAAALAVTACARNQSGQDGSIAGQAVPGSAQDFVVNVGDRVYFEVDQTDLTPLARDTLNKQAQWLARTPKGAVTASKVILAVNGHIQNFGFFRGRLMHVFTYASMTAPFRGQAGRDRWALLPADPMGATVRKITHDDGSRIVFRSRFTYNPSLETSQACLDRLVRSHRKGFDARFPDLAGVAFDYTWGGRLCLSRNHAPAFGEVEEGLFSACCENGLGTVKSTLAGVMAADLACGEPSVALDAFRNHPTPSRLPPEPIAALGASFIIRLQEIRAGREG